MKKILCLLLILLSLGLFAACGEEAPIALDGSELDLEDLEQTALDPSSLYWGGSEESDRWYDASGKKYLYFESAENGIIAHKVEGIQDVQINCQVEKNMRLVNKAGEPGKLSILFANTFNLFDEEAGIWYSRGDLGAMRGLFANKLFMEASDPGNSYYFNEDGTCIEGYNDEDFDGYWEVEACSVLGCYFPDGEDLFRFQVSFADDGSVASFSDGTRTFYPVN